MYRKKNTPNEITPITQQSAYITEILQIIRSNLTPKRMREQILSYHENDIAAALDFLKKDERSRFYSVLDAASLANILEYSEKLADYLAELGIKKRVEILSQLEPSTMVSYLQQMEKAERELLLELMPDSSKRQIALLSSFDTDEIGSKMSANYIAIPEHVGVRQAMKELISQAADNDNISTIYVLDQDRTLLGAIDLKDLIIARENTELDSIIMTSYPYVYANEQIADCIERIKDYSEDSIPVLDAENRLAGILTAQDLTQLVDDELGDDYAKLAGLTAEEDLQESVKKSIGKRLPWLVILLGLGMIVSSVVSLFEQVVAHLSLIICFQSLVLDMAGNVGTQSLAVTIRVLMDEQISGRQKISLVVKESRVGLVNGFILGILSFVLVGGYLFVIKGNPAIVSFSISLCTGTALLLSMLLSSVVGTIIPIFFKKIHIDPAVASGPLITTVNDLVAVVSYYGLAWLLLIQVLHL